MCASVRRGAVVWLLLYLFALYICIYILYYILYILCVHGAHENGCSTNNLTIRHIEHARRIFVYIRNGKKQKKNRRSNRRTRNIEWPRAVRCPHISDGGEFLDKRRQN